MKWQKILLSIKGGLSLEDVCELYYKIKVYESNIRSFNHSKKNIGINHFEIYANEVRGLIHKAKKHKLDESYPIFREPVKKLEEAYKDYF